MRSMPFGGIVFTIHYTNYIFGGLEVNRIPYFNFQLRHLSTNLAAYLNIIARQNMHVWYIYIYIYIYSFRPKKLWKLSLITISWLWPVSLKPATPRRSRRISIPLNKNGSTRRCHFQRWVILSLWFQYNSYGKSLRSQEFSGSYTDHSSFNIIMVSTSVYNYGTQHTLDA